jgi:NADH:ubiquinone oxidoreductase subunit 5 (subunit L)/multisubunit Na+/H+ antiporter MnhA subunit
MPRTGLFFLVASAAICGLPPLNGFVSEFLLYLSSLHGLSAGPGSPVPVAAAGILTAGTLALIGGLALACFAKAFGIVFLGEPRVPRTTAVVESPGSMTFPMGLLALLCVVLGLSGPLLVLAVRPAVDLVCAGRIALPGVEDGGAADALLVISLVFAGMMLAASLLLAARAAILRRRNPAVAPTWGCGFQSPTARMQYTSSSFADPIVRIFAPLLGTRRRIVAPQGYFPSAASLSTSTPDVYREGIYRPLFSFFERVFSRARMIQHGRVNLYVLYIVAALIALLLWKLR